MSLFTNTGKTRKQLGTPRSVKLVTILITLLQRQLKLISQNKWHDCCTISTDLHQRLMKLSLQPWELKYGTHQVASLSLEVMNVYYGRVYQKQNLDINGFASGCGIFYPPFDYKVFNKLLEAIIFHQVILIQVSCTSKFIWDIIYNSNIHVFFEDGCIEDRTVKMLQEENGKSRWFYDSSSRNWQWRK